MILHVNPLLESRRLTWNFKSYLPRKLRCHYCRLLQRRFKSNITDRIIRGLETFGVLTKCWKIQNGLNRVFFVLLFSMCIYLTFDRIV